MTRIATEPPAGTVHQATRPGSRHEGAPRLRREDFPAAVFAPPELVAGVFVHVRTQEVSLFTVLPPDEVAARCAALVPGVEPRVREVEDVYYDTPERALYARRLSVRLRRYPGGRGGPHFEVICIALDVDAGPGALHAERENTVLVQTFERNGPAEHAALLERYAAAGLVPVATLEKTRTRFELLGVTSHSSAGGVVHGADVHGVRTADGDLVTVDHGLKLLVDHVHGGLFAEPTIVEVEFDTRHRERAHALLRRVGEALGPGVRGKGRNKISYLLEGDR